jgi:transcriptional regulator with XRE-family HTH domain
MEDTSLASSRRYSKAARCGARIREVRERQGLSLRNLARRMEESHQVLSKVERGTVDTRIDMLTRIAAALGVPVSMFLQDDDGTPLFDETLPLEVSILRDLLAMFQRAYVPMPGVI